MPDESSPLNNIDQHWERFIKISYWCIAYKKFVEKSVNHLKLRNDADDDDVDDSRMPKFFCILSFFSLAIAGLYWMEIFSNWHFLKFD